MGGGFGADFQWYLQPQARVTVVRLEGKVAIVTGAASGIGRACAELFEELGAKVLRVDWKREAGCYYADVSREEDVEGMVRAAVDRFGALHVIVNNAAVQILAPLAETSLEDWERLQSVNLRGVFLGCKHAIPVIARSGGGSVVNMSSALGLVGDPDLAAYGAMKGGIIAMTKAAAVGYGPAGVRVNCICPGDVNTPMVQEYFAKPTDPEALRRQVYSHYALRRIAEPREIAQVAAFLASDESSFMTGSVLVVDGGLTSRCY